MGLINDKATTMNIKNKYTILIALVTSLIFSGCRDDVFNGGNGVPAEVGDEIFFGGSLRHEPMAKTRTVYGDKGSSGTEIKWYAGDKVRIFCAEANAVAGNQFVDYSVDDVVSSTESPTDGTVETYHNSSLSIAADEPYGLQWGSEGNHNFYGVYPSPDMYYVEGSEIQSQAYSTLNFDIASKTLTGFLPASQEPQSYRKNASKDANGVVTYTMYPAMRYAYMLAQQTAKPAAGKVSLTFKPIVTAVEITIENTMKPTSSTGQTQSQTLADISMVGVESTEGAICGKFTTQISGTADNPIFTNNNESDGEYKSISVPVMSAAVVTGTGAGTQIQPNDASTSFNPVTLRAGDKLKFTVFMLPNADLSTLKVKIMVGSSVKTATLNGNNMEDFKIYAQKKNFIANIPLSYDRPISTSESNWISSLPDATEFKRLSIPGAGGVGSNVLDATQYNGYMEQTIDIPSLWARGIRCFEFGVDGVATSGSDSNQSLGNSKILANGISTGTNLSVAIEQIQGLLRSNPREFAVVIISYTPSASGEGNYGRQARRWSQEFYTYWTSVNTNFTGEVTDPIDNTKKIKLGTAMLTSKTTVGDARGKLFCIARPTAIGGDPWWYSLNRNPNNAVTVAGWGPMPDQWYARGYVKGNRPYSVTKDASNATLDATEGGTNYLYPIYSDATPDQNYHEVEYGSLEDKFVYNVFKNPGNTSSLETDQFRDDVKVLAQEWRRVCGTEGGFKHTLKKTKTNSGIFGSTTVEQDFTYYWAYSYDEKKNDIIETFNKAISDDGTSGIIYINSLCGYYIDSNIPLSYQNQRHRVRFYAGTDSDTQPIDDTQYNLSTTKDGSLLSGGDATVYSYDDQGGTQGDIAGFAADVNEFFYDYIKSVGANNINGATGIILMDRIAPESDKSTNPAGYYLPQIILNNNFRGSASTTNFSLPRDREGFNQAGGDVPAAPQRRGTSNAGVEAEVVWK